MAEKRDIHSGEQTTQEENVLTLLPSSKSEMATALNSLLSSFFSLKLFGAVLTRYSSSSFFLGVVVIA